jgi:hypothetical protein
MIENYGGATPPGTFTLVEYHLGDAYSTTWGSARQGFYSVTGTPTAIFDGVQSVVGAGSVDSAYANYIAKYNLRMAVATDVTIDLGGRLLSGTTYEVKAKVGIEAGGAGKSLRIYMVQVLDNYPTSPNYERYTFIQSPTTHGSEDVVTLAANDSVMITHNFTLSGPSAADPNNVKIVAWAQDYPTSKNIWQAATLHWPPTPLQLLGDMNGDDIVDVSDISMFVLAQTDLPAWQALYPDIVLLEAGDMNQDGIFNGADVQAFSWVVINDQTPPTPNPMTWEVAPTPISTTEIIMTASEAVDPSGVEYYITATGIGAVSSGWMSTREFSSSPLQANRSYSYKVKARDQSPQQNTTADSTPVVYKATFIETPVGLTVGTPTSTDVPLTAIGPFSRLNTALSGLYFEVTDMAGTPAGTGAAINAWRTSSVLTTATATGLTPNTTYRLRVKARNYYADETPWYPAADYIYVTTAP